MSVRKSKDKVIHQLGNSIQFLRKLPVNSTRKIKANLRENDEENLRLMSLEIGTTKINLFASKFYKNGFP